MTAGKIVAEFDDGAGVAYTIAKLREELNDLYSRPRPKTQQRVKTSTSLLEVGPSIIGRLQQIDHLQRYQIACLEHQLAKALNPPKHRFWGAGEPDCPREIKAGNGELHTLRCKVCGKDDPRDERCLGAAAIQPTDTE
jgi:hypothetical protein